MCEPSFARVWDRDTPIYRVFLVDTLAKPAYTRANSL